MQFCSLRSTVFYRNKFQCLHVFYRVEKYSWAVKRTQTNYTAQITEHVVAGLRERITTSFSDLIICGTYNKLTPTSWPTLYVWAPVHFKLRAACKVSTIVKMCEKRKFWWSFLYYTNKEPLSFVGAPIADSFVSVIRPFVKIKKLLCNVCNLIVLETRYYQILIVIDWKLGNEKSSCKKLVEYVIRAL